MASRAQGPGTALRVSEWYGLTKPTAMEEMMDDLPGHNRKIDDAVEDLERQLLRQQVAAWFVTGASIVAIVVIYCAILSTLSS